MEKIDASEVFKPSDFESIRLVIHFQNFTIGNEVRDSEKISLIEIGNKTLVFEVPRTSCNVGHNVVIAIGRVVPGDTKVDPVLNVTGKVQDVTKVDADVIRATVDCMQYDEASWNDLTSMYSKRQEEIMRFFAAAKGL